MKNEATGGVFARTHSILVLLPRFNFFGCDTRWMVAAPSHWLTETKVCHFRRGQLLNVGLMAPSTAWLAVGEKLGARNLPEHQPRREQ